MMIEKVMTQLGVHFNIKVAGGLGGGGRQPPDDSNRGAMIQERVPEYKKQREGWRGLPA